MLSIQENARGIVFKVFVQPRSSKNMIAGLQGDALKIKLKAPPVDGAANKMCIEYLAKCLNLPKSSFEIISGYTSRTKRMLVRFTGQNSTAKIETEQLKRSILALLNP